MQTLTSYPSRNSIASMSRCSRHLFFSPRSRSSYHQVLSSCTRPDYVSLTGLIAKLRELWIIPLFFILTTVVSMVVAYVLGVIMRLKKSQRCVSSLQAKHSSNLVFVRSFAIAAAMFMNSNSLPIALMQSLVVTVTGLKWDEDDNKDAMVGRALTYLVLYSTLGMVVSGWTIMSACIYHFNPCLRSAGATVCVCYHKQIRKPFRPKPRLPKPVEPAPSSALTRYRSPHPPQSSSSCAMRTSPRPLLSLMTRGLHKESRTLTYPSRKWTAANFSIRSPTLLTRGQARCRHLIPIPLRSTKTTRKTTTASSVRVVGNAPSRPPPSSRPAPVV